MHNLEGIITFGYTGASPKLMGACAKRHIALTFMTANGRFLARIVGESHGNVLLRQAQHKVSNSEALSAGIAKNFIVGKLFNGRWVLARAIRDHPMRIDINKMQEASGALNASIKNVLNANNLETIRGCEGEAASRYFGVFDGLILQQKSDFYFNGRNRRPPLDNVNAMLSFVYSLLAHDVAAALESVGLDPYIGFLHRDRPGRISLALDMMEELRPIMADRFVLSLINRKQVSPKGFDKRENGAVTMDDDTRKTILSAWQERKKEMITHPFLEEKLEWGLVPYAQAMLLARFLRDDIDSYPPFLWK